MDDFQLSEISKCADDPLYFINTYCKIVSLDKGVTLFKTFEYQDRFINLIHENRFVAAVMARQNGKSVTIAAYALHFMMFNPEKVVAILANKAMIARESLSRLSAMYERLPDWMKTPVKVWNKSKIILGNGSQCHAAATSISAIRGLAVAMCIIDEVAHVDRNKFHEFYDSVYPTISSGTDSKLILISTPLGRNFFYDLYTKAERGEAGWVSICAPWYMHPNRDEKWKKITMAGLIGDKELKFAQEFACDFATSSKTLIPGDILSTLTSLEPIKKSEEISIFENPTPNETYIITNDTSEGIGEDSQAFSILKVVKDGLYLKTEQVVTFDCPNTAPDQFAYIVAKYGKIYNYAWILMERASTGAEILNLLFEEIEYENIVFVSTNRGGEEMGLTPTVKTKRIGCAELKSMIESGALKINCEKTLGQLRRFIRHNNSYAADKGYHDDLVMGLVNFAYMTKQENFQSNVLDFLKTKKTLSEDYLIPDIIQSAIPVIEKKRQVHSHTGSFLVGDVSELDSDELAWLMA